MRSNSKTNVNTNAGNKKGGTKSNRVPIEGKNNPGTNKKSLNTKNKK